MNNPSAGGNRATNVRYRVVSMAVLLAMITYMDRSCISVLAKDIMRDLSLTKLQMGYVFTAFAAAYALFEIPTAWWADRAGARNVLTRIVTWWSIFTIATAVAFNLAYLLIVRFLFGAGEAGAWPSVARVFSRWASKRERGTVQGIFFAGAHFAGGTTPLLIILLSAWFGWRTIFVLFGMLGFIWAIVWFRWFRDDPAEHSSVSRSELEYIEKDRPREEGHSVGWEYWRRLAARRNTWALCLMYFPNSFAFYFCITWLPTYLEERFGFVGWKMALFAGLPLFLSVVSDMLGGVVTDWAYLRFGPRIGRCGVGAAVYLLAGAAMVFAAFSNQSMLSAVALSLGAATSMFALGASWGACLDIGGKNSGVVSATMNTSGQIGSIICPIVVPLVMKAFDDWAAPLYLIGVLFFAGAIFWAFIDPRKPIFE
ncbi:MAG: MFS transporter [Pirellulales bacterium]|nr:MFS transporter [Pirellulales bacterium]